MKPLLWTLFLSLPLATAAMADERTARSDEPATAVAEPDAAGMADADESLAKRHRCVQDTGSRLRQNRNCKPGRSMSRDELLQHGATMDQISRHIF